MYRFVLSDRTIEGVINGLIATGKLTEAQVDHAAIEGALEQMLTAWASHWT